MRFAGSLSGFVTCDKVIHIETSFHDTDELGVDFGKCVEMVVEGDIQQEG